MASGNKTLSTRFFTLPFFALIVLAIVWTMSPPNWALALLGALLIVTVFTAVHHAEVIALRVGEPFGSLTLALAVTIIEVGMIVVLIWGSPNPNENLARDTVFAAIMITTNGIVGLALLVKALKQKTAVFNANGVSGALAALVALSVLTLVLPSVTVSSPGPTFTKIQLLFAAIVSLAIYITFIAVQTVRHRDYFLPPPKEDQTISEEAHVKPTSTKEAIQSLCGLIISLITVVGLAKITSPLVQGVVDDYELPQMLVAISIAMVVLLPESISAINSARYGRTQTSLNLAYGSALASIGLTIPVIALISIFSQYQFNLGLNPTELVLLALTFAVSILTVVPGRATLLQSVIHLSIFGSFLMFAATP
jgi:Ca2+:H+ antiporter